ncbi:DUF4129 domain-containing protein [Mycobacterium sp. MMS18-G62]
MAGVDRSTQRVIAVIVLLIITATALRGYLPGVDRAAAHERPQSSPLALFVDIALLTVAVGIIAFAIIARLRDRTPRRAGMGQLPRGPGAMGRPTWRFSLIALGLIVGWLLIVLTLMQLGRPNPVDQPPAPPETTSQTAAPPTPDVNRPQPDSPPESESNVVDYLVGPMLVLMVVVVAGTAIAARRQRATALASTPGDGIEPEVSAAAADSLARAAEHGLAEIEDLSREPREAIIACYVAMERELTNVPGAAPQDFDTPTEVLARAVHLHALRADSATQLVDLFEEARFSPHVMNEGHRDIAVRVLRLVLTELRSVA